MVIDAVNKVTLTLTLDELSALKTICHEYVKVAGPYQEGLKNAADRFDKFTESTVTIGYWRSIYDTFNEE